MPPVLRYVTASYRATLRLYPAGLRLAYGKEMEEVFEQLLFADWKRRGVRGIAATGGRAFYELLAVAIPERIFNERIIAPGLSVVISTGVLLSLVAVMMHPPRILTVQERLIRKNEQHKTSTHCVRDSVRGVCKPV